MMNAESESEEEVLYNLSNGRQYIALQNVRFDDQNRLEN